MKFDVSPGGMHETSQQTSDHGQDINADVESLLTAFADAASACGGGLVGDELARLSGDVEHKTGLMSSRVERAVYGGHQIADIHVDGDHEMADNVGQCRDKADSGGSDMPGQGGR